MSFTDWFAGIPVRVYSYDEEGRSVPEDCTLRIKPLEIIRYHPTHSEELEREGDFSCTKIYTKDGSAYLCMLRVEIFEKIMDKAT
jgi:hypothetical protein